MLSEYKFTQLMKGKLPISLSCKFNFNSDFIGAFASGFCLLHCMMTPFLFAVQATSLSCSEISPWWWKIVDYIFLVITFFAIYYTNQTTSSHWMPKALYACWALLLFLVVNNSLHVLPIPHFLIYIPAMCLALLHLYNRRYCNCKEERCCAATEGF